MKSQDLKKFKLPDLPGIYFFKKGKNILYIGKATSLKNRVSSYFSSDLLKTRGLLITKMIEEATGVSFQKTDSVLEALLLEADLIKKFKPFYNTDGKDDKSGNCVVITDEDFPRVLVVRKRELDFSSDPKSKIPARPNGRPPGWIRFGRGSGGLNLKSAFVAGPYPNGGELREALKIIRRIFPWRDDKCLPCAEQKKLKNECRPCFNRQIGLCPGVCTSEITKRDYGKIINRLKLLFRGKISVLLDRLEKEMNVAAKNESFEEAALLKRALFALKHIQDVSLIKRYELSPALRLERRAGQSRPFRIEAYDIAHISGSNMVGAMVVMENGEPKKSDYRKFRIRSIAGPNDPGALAEVLNRRLRHPEWPLPDLIVVDGNEVQKEVAEKIVVLKELKIFVVAVVKDKYHKPREILGLASAGERNRQAILLANSEAHRFALRYHRNSRRLLME